MEEVAQSSRVDLTSVAKMVQQYLPMLNTRLK